MANAWIVTAILKLLSGLPQKEAKGLLQQASQHFEIEKQLDAIPREFCANTFRQPRKTKIGSDPEVEQFILSLPYLNQADILTACKARFGSERTPSSAGLSRYLRAQRAIK